MILFLISAFFPKKITYCQLFLLGSNDYFLSATGIFYYDMTINSFWFIASNFNFGIFCVSWMFLTHSNFSWFYVRQFSSFSSLINHLKDRAYRNQEGNGLRMYGPGYRGLVKKVRKVSHTQMVKLAFTCAMNLTYCEPLCFTILFAFSVAVFLA